MYPTAKQHTAARPHDLLGYRWWVVRISMMMKGRTVVCWEGEINIMLHSVSGETKTIAISLKNLVLTLEFLVEPAMFHILPFREKHIVSIIY